MAFGISHAAAALPRRIVLAVDGISFRDLKALQEGLVYQDSNGKLHQYRAFQEGYFPVSRMVSTFPSASDVAWSEIFGVGHLAGYQRTYFSQAANAKIAINGVTSSVEFERRMHFRVPSGVRHATVYLAPVRAFRRELDEMVEHFFKETEDTQTYYAYIASPDAAQHMNADVFTMLRILDEKVRDMRERYRRLEGRELEVLMISDHGNNRAGPGKRVRVGAYLKQAGYRVSNSIGTSRDVVLPTMGIESWVEVHNAPSETERLAELLSRMEGADIVTACLPGTPERFLVLNRRGERAMIDYSSLNDSYRYAPEKGDPLEYKSILEELACEGQGDAEGFVSAEAWMRHTVAARYPVALERIVRGHTRVTMNPATILVSLANGYVHASWLVKKGSELMHCAGTHGGLDDLNSTGILLSSSAPTQDTTSSRVAAACGGFQDLREYRSLESGAELIPGKQEVLAMLNPTLKDWPEPGQINEKLLLRVWSPQFESIGFDRAIDLLLAPSRPAGAAKVRRGEGGANAEKWFRLAFPACSTGGRPWERLYALPPELGLRAGGEYRLRGWLDGQKRGAPLFDLVLRTNAEAVPVAW